MTSSAPVSEPARARIVIGKTGRPRSGQEDEKRPTLRHNHRATRSTIQRESRRNSEVLRLQQEVPHEERRGETRSMAPRSIGMSVRPHPS